MSKVPQLPDVIWSMIAEHASIKKRVNCFVLRLRVSLSNRKCRVTLSETIPLQANLKAGSSAAHSNWSELQIQNHVLPFNNVHYEGDTRARERLLHILRRENKQVPIPITTPVSQSLFGAHGCFTLDERGNLDQLYWYTNTSGEADIPPHHQEAARELLQLFTQLISNALPHLQVHADANVYKMIYETVTFVEPPTIIYNNRFFKDILICETKRDYPPLAKNTLHPDVRYRALIAQTDKTHAHQHMPNRKEESIYRDIAVSPVYTFSPQTFRQMRRRSRRSLSPVRKLSLGPVSPSKRGHRKKRRSGRSGRR